MTKYFITPEKLAEANILLADFHAAIPQERGANSVSKVSTLNIGEIFNSITKMLKEEMDVLILIIRAAGKPIRKLPDRTDGFAWNDQTCKEVKTLQVLFCLVRSSLRTRGTKREAICYSMEPLKSFHSGLNPLIKTSFF